MPESKDLKADSQSLQLSGVLRLGDPLSELAPEAVGCPLNERRVRAFDPTDTLGALIGQSTPLAEEHRPRSALRLAGRALHRSYPR
jgi:hypothetical protein